MRLAFVAAVMVLTGCGADPECRRMQDDACAGADLVVTFDEAPGTRGMVCQWWSDGRSARFRTDGFAWCAVE